LGARTEDILKLLTLTFVKRIAIAFLLATPVAYYLMQRWLESFVYRISLGIALFVSAAAMVFVVAVITLSFQTLKAAFTNPVEELKNE
jgi:putative ABC transport system permease protein